LIVSFPTLILGLIMSPTPKQTPTEAVVIVRNNLAQQIHYLRKFDEETTEQAARRVERLRWELRKFVIREAEKV
jgi:hypothetical protein